MDNYENMGYDKLFISIDSEFDNMLTIWGRN